MSEITHAYAQASVLTAGHEGKALQLAAYAEGAPAGATSFFQGQLRDSWLTARGLTTLAKVVAARFVPQAPVLRDPIVTAGAAQLRFEAFSSCNGVYARLDLGPAALDGEISQSGTTNVDFNEPMVNALSRIGRNEPVGLAVGQQAVTLERADGHVTERKVALPDRWLRGLTAAQGYLAQMDERLRLGRVQAAQLLHGLPAGAVRAATYLAVRRARPSFGALGGPRAVRVGGAHRLRLLDGLLPLAQAARVYGTPDGQACAVILELGGGHTFTLALSAEVNRGFSGEGTQLADMLDELPAEWLAGGNNLFQSNEVFNPLLFGLTHDLAPATVARLCASLAGLGLLGFDLMANQYFYRRLPFQPERLLRLNPRLKNAQALLASDNDDVRLVSLGANGRAECRVRGTDTWHTVLVGGAEPPRCTCQWHAAHQGQRGACKHVLAAQLRFGQPEPAIKLAA